MQFAFKLEDNLFALHDSLHNKRWCPEAYVSFFVTDPKRRHIHKATVHDRVLYQAVYRKLYPVFDKSFIHDSYSSRVGMGTHAGVARLEGFIRKTSANYTIQVYALKCDVQKFFDSIDHSVLQKLIARHIKNHDLLLLIWKIIKSFETTSGKGLPLGNVTSQLFANIYLNELDQFVKRKLMVRHYIRYCDDFVVLTKTRGELKRLIVSLHFFLETKLFLMLHPEKMYIRTIKQGIDFLGYVALPRFCVLRTKTKRRLLARHKKNISKYQKGGVSKEYLRNTFYSYKGMLIRGRTFMVYRQLDNAMPKGII